MREGHQCGMLWGAALAAGAEALRRHGEPDRAIGAAVAATQRLVASFEATAASSDCREISRTDFRSRLGTLKYLLTGGVQRCFALADTWAPRAIRTADEELGSPGGSAPPPAASCASEVARRLGASDRHAVMVAGFAGGLGLAGHGCGALGAAVWLDTHAWCERQPKPVKSAFDNPAAKRTLKVFQEAIGSELRCERIAGRRFTTVADHTEFVRSGGCERVIAALTGSQARASTAV